MKINAVQLREYLDSMHGEADARDLRSEAIRKIVKSAAGDGYDGKTLRKIFVRERMEPETRQRADDMLEVYEQALGGKGRALAAIAAGAPVGEASKANGVHRATVARARNVAKQGSNATEPHGPSSDVYTPHDPATGEIKEEGSLSGRDEKSDEHSNAVPIGADESLPALSAPQSALNIGAGADTNSASNDREDGEASQDASPATSDCAIGVATPPLGASEREASAPATSDIDITLPKFLDRRVSP